MTKHTPALGPWKVIDVGFAGRGKILRVITDDKNRFLVADVLGLDTQERECARLIAAAPETAAERDRLKAINAELVEALKGLVATYWAEDQTADLTKARAAIAAAEGKEG